MPVRNTIPLSEHLHVRLSKKQKLRVIAAADSVGIPWPEWVRAAINEQLKRCERDNKGMYVAERR